MGKPIELKIGGDRFGLSLPDEADILMTREPQPTASRQGFAADLNAALPAGPFRGGRVAVVVADKTRLCGYDRYLPISHKAIGATAVRPRP